MKYLSVCSGIEAATVAWHPLGWEPVGFAEIEAFPSAVLAHHYPQVPNHGDFTSIDAPAIDLLVGGTPCQSFSVAGLRGGLADDRGNLALEFLRLAHRTRARWVVWENVPGVLSSNEGRDFGSILGALVELGYGFAYRVLDAQHFGVPQRRRRVFVVGHLGGGTAAAAVLFERASLRGDSASLGEAREDAAGTLGGGSGSRGWAPDTDRMTFLPFDETQITSKANRSQPDFGDSCHPLAAGAARPPGVAIHAPRVALCLTAHEAKGGDPTTDNYVCVTGTVTHTLKAEGFDASEDGTGRGQPIVPTEVRSAAQVRRLTPLECERLQGFPDDYTLIPYRGKPAADGPRYKALGNSMAVPVMRWIGERIARVDAVVSRHDAQTSGRSSVSGSAGRDELNKRLGVEEKTK